MLTLGDRPHRDYCPCDGLWGHCCDNPANYPEVSIVDDEHGIRAGGSIVDNIKGDSPVIPANYIDVPADDMDEREDTCDGSATTGCLSRLPGDSEVSPRASDEPKELCSAIWRMANVRDSLHVQTKAMNHICGPSCWKHNRNGTSICKHHCYHITDLEPDASGDTPAEKPLKLRRDGRPLNNQMYIQEDSTKGKKGLVSSL